MNPDLRDALENLFKYSFSYNDKHLTYAQVRIEDLISISSMLSGAQSEQTLKWVQALKKDQEKSARQTAEAQAWDDWRDSLVKKDPKK